MLHINPSSSTTTRRETLLLDQRPDSSCAGATHLLSELVPYAEGSFNQLCRLLELRRQIHRNDLLITLRFELDIAVTAATPTAKMAEVNGNAPQINGHLSASPTSQPTAPSQPLPISLPMAQPSVPATSIQDNGSGKRPRDARLIHMLLSSLGVTAYQERVPLQLLDFAYRHSSSILSDALHLSADAYVSQNQRARDAPPGGFRDLDGQVSANAVQLAIQSRLQYQFSGGNAPGLSKEFLLETAQKRNSIALPRVLQNEWGVRLPSERFVLTGVPWSLQEEWPSEEPEGGVAAMDGIEIAEDQGVEDTEGGTMDDIFGTEDVDGEE